MHVLKVIQWLLGLIICFYLYKGLLGKLKTGDGRKAGVVALVWFTITMVTSGLINLN